MKNQIIKLLILFFIVIGCYNQGFSQADKYVNWKSELKKSDSLYTLKLTTKIDSGSHIFFTKEPKGIGEIIFQLDSLSKVHFSLITPFNIESDFYTELDEIFATEVTRTKGNIILSLKFKTTSIKNFKGILSGTLCIWTGSNFEAYNMRFCLVYIDSINKVEIKTCK